MMNWAYGVEGDPMSESTDTQRPTWTDSDCKPVELTPKTLLERYYNSAYMEQYTGTSLFERLLTPKTRALVVGVLVSEGDELLTTKKIANAHPDLSVSGVNRQKDALLDHGIMVEGETIGNAPLYRLNTEHPFAQVLRMLHNIGMWGRTDPLLSEAFVFEGDADEFVEAVEADDVPIPSDADE